MEIFGAAKKACPGDDAANQKRPALEITGRMM
jgi:hypothetical protein